MKYVPIQPRMVTIFSSFDSLTVEPGSTSIFILCVGDPVVYFLCCYDSLPEVFVLQMFLYYFLHTSSAIVDNIYYISIIAAIYRMQFLNS